MKQFHLRKGGARGGMNGMGSIGQQRVAEVGRFLPATADEAISIGALARGLGVSFGTARRRLAAYAEARGLVLEAGRARVGARGPESTVWYLRPALQLEVREGVLAALPRTAEAALSKPELLSRIEPRLSKQPDAKQLASWLSDALKDPHLGVVVTASGRLYLDPSTAKTTRVLAVKRRRQPATRSPTRSPRAESKGASSPGHQALLASARTARGLPDTLPAAAVAALTPDERAALAHLLHHHLARTSELATALGRAPSRVDGMLRALRRKLHAHGGPRFTDEALPSGETLYRLVQEPRR